MPNARVLVARIEPDLLVELRRGIVEEGGQDYTVYVFLPPYDLVQARQHGKIATARPGRSKIVGVGPGEHLENALWQERGECRGEIYVLAGILEPETGAIHAPPKGTLNPSSFTRAYYDD